MQIENHKEEVPFAHYEELFRAVSPEDVVSRLSRSGVFREASGQRISDCPS